MASIALESRLVPFALEGTDGKVHRPEEYAGATVLGIIFTCNHCPYAQAWEGRLIEAQRAYADRGVQLLLINSNDPRKVPDDSFEQMQRRAAAKGYPFPYLFDETQEIAKAYGASRTPEIFLFDRTRVLRYHGAPDDNYDNPHAVQHAYLRGAIDALLTGGVPPVSETRPVGCTIKWKQVAPLA